MISGLPLWRTHTSRPLGVNWRRTGRSAPAKKSANFRSLRTLRMVIVCEPLFATQASKPSGETFTSAGAVPVGMLAAYTRWRSMTVTTSSRILATYRRRSSGVTSARWLSPVPVFQIMRSSPFCALSSRTEPSSSAGTQSLEPLRFSCSPVVGVKAPRSKTASRDRLQRSKTRIEEPVESMEALVRARLATYAYRPSGDTVTSRMSPSAGSPSIRSREIASKSMTLPLASRKANAPCAEASPTTAARQATRSKSREANRRIVGSFLSALRTSVPTHRKEHRKPQRTFVPSPPASGSCKSSKSTKITSSPVEYDSNPESRFTSTTYATRP